MYFHQDFVKTIQGTLLFTFIFKAKKPSGNYCIQSVDIYAFIKSCYSLLCKRFISCLKHVSNHNQVQMQPVKRINSVPTENLNDRLFFFLLVAS